MEFPIYIDVSNIRRDDPAAYDLFLESGCCITVNEEGLLSAVFDVAGDECTVKWQPADSALWAVDGDEITCVAECPAAYDLFDIAGDEITVNAEGLLSAVFDVAGDEVTVSAEPVSSALWLVDGDEISIL